MNFGNVKYFYLLWLLPGLVFFYIYAFRAKRRAIEAFCSAQLADRLMPYVSWGKQRFKAALLIMAVLFIIIALVQPRWDFQWEEAHQRGVDIVIALDVSRSMLAEDVKPSRLERAKREIMDLLDILEGDRVGLVAFAGTAFVQCPLTLDYAAAKIFLDYLDAELIPVQGTNLGQTIRVAIKAFSAQERKSKALVLITDGEGHEGEAMAAAKEAKKEGIKIFAIGIGQRGGAPIPLQDKSGGFKKDKHGEMVLTRLDEATLQKIALATAGSYVRSVSGNLDLEELYFKGIKERTEEKELKGVAKKRWEERFQLFALTAFLLLVWESLWGQTKRVRKS